MNRAAIVVVVLLALLLLGGETVVSRIVNGSRVGPRTELRDDGLVDGDPFALADAAGMDPNAYALARCLASEHGQDADAYLVAVAWAVTNKAAERGVTVIQLLTDGAGSAGDGMFGEQKSAAGTKYASTRVDPSERHAQVATAVISGTLFDPTGGATHFYSPKAQDQLAAKAAAGDTRYAKYAGKDAAFIDRTWRAPGGLYPGGAVSVVPAGVDARTLTLYRRAA
ncbi:MAG: hypothetical protein ACJ8GN_02120 [Longimicrobiaceae bacterium]